MLIPLMKSFFSRFRAQIGLLGLLMLCASPALWSCNTAIDTSAYDQAVKDALAHQEKYKAIDDTIILGYLKRHNYTTATYQRTASGLYLVTLMAGTGTPIAVGNHVSVRYTGKFVSAATENNVFDTSVHAATATTPATDGYDFIVNPNNFIQGWTEGLLLMRQGDHKLLLIPSYLAYGPTGAGAAIAPDTPILFDMTVLTVSP